ncbi:MAG TPA: AMP-binding protein [Acidimicrobiales bacterium]|nr:AMP-binding protein [Acidimicrobiales bacterium]
MPRELSRSVVRLGQAAQNALEVVRFGGLETGAEPTPFEVVANDPMYRLRRYGTGGHPPVLLVPPLMLAADVYDVSPQSSAVAALSEAGLDPWVIDFGSPEHEEGGLERTLTDHVLALSRAIDEVNRVAGPIHLSGYSQGGMFCYQVAAYRRAEGIASLITYGSPVDTHGILPFGLDDELVVDAIDLVADKVLPRASLPGWLTRVGFRLIDPVGVWRNRVQFVMQLHDRDSLLAREGQRRFLMDEGWVAWPGPALAELVKQFVVSNRMLSGGFVIDGQPVTLADVECPILCFVGSSDDIAPPETVRAVAQAAPAADVYETTLDAGHFGLVVGSQAATRTWPTVEAWVRWIDGDGDLPEAATQLSPDDPPQRRRLNDLERAVGLAAGIGTGVGRTVVNGARAGARSARALTIDATNGLLRLNRIEEVRPTSQVSLGRIFAEQAQLAPDETAFLFEDRGHTYAAANERIDNVVRGLISIGVRRGSHVGVLMDTRPSALGIVAALNRLGAVAVLLRPDGILEREVELGRVHRIVADPENSEQASRIKGVQVHALGGGGGPRDLGSAVDDMEAIDPDAVTLPGWYEPDPGRAQDLAFILFTGSGERTRVNRITNGRWALSAFGTAAAASLNRTDTVLSLTPIHHPSALLTGIGGALAGRARLAMTRGFDPDTFWEEVRRYGATAVTYTWTMAADLLDAPAGRRDKNHPIRLFIGAGMPAGLWRRVEQQFAPAKVVELYASTEGGAVLVNPKGEKVGSLGRRLPGSAPLKIARFDVEGGRLVEGPDGFAVECDVGEVGMLLAKLSPRDGAYPDRALRALFEGGDAWLPTGDLVRVDEDGDHWLVGGAASLIRTPQGYVPPLPVQDAIEALDEVHLSVAHPVDEPDGTLSVGLAVRLCEGQELDPARVTAALGELPPAHRPRYVQVVDEIPRTTWYRVRTEPLRAQGIPTGPDTLVLDPASGTYRRLGGAKRRSSATGAARSTRSPAPRGRATRSA